MLAITPLTKIHKDFFAKTIKHNIEIRECKFLLLFADNITI